MRNLRLRAAVLALAGWAFVVCVSGCVRPVPVYDPPAPTPRPGPVDPTPRPQPPVDPTPTDVTHAPELAPAVALREAFQGGATLDQAAVKQRLEREPRSGYTENWGARRYVERYYFPSATQTGVEYGAYVYYDKVGGKVVDVKVE